MDRNRFFFPLFLVVLVSSCEKKEVSSIIYPSVYHKVGLAPIGKLRVFSSAGEIHRSSVVSRFSRYDTSYLSHYASSLRNDPTIMDSVNFFDSLHATLDYENKKLDCLIAIESNFLILTETDASRKCCSADDVFTRSLPYQMVRMKPEVHTEFIHSSSGGNYSFGFTGRRKYVLKESHGKLVAPLILYTRHSGKFESGFVNNVLQRDFYSSLAAGDTLSLMEFQIHFEK
jgi:hypothetical protein